MNDAKFFEELRAYLRDLNARLINLETYEQAAGAVSSGVHVYKSGYQAGLIPGAWHAITLDTELWDTDAYHTGADAFCTAPYDGRYLVNARVEYDYTPGFPPTQLEARININDTYYHRETLYPGTLDLKFLTLTTIANLSAGDIVYLDVWTTVNNVDIITDSTEYGTYLQLELVG